jgi:hypothetical protein
MGAGVAPLDHLRELRPRRRRRRRRRRVLALGGAGPALLGQPLSAGSATSGSEESGRLVALPANPLLGLAVADWTAAARASGDFSAAHARAALVDLASRTAGWRPSPSWRGPARPPSTAPPPTAGDGTNGIVTIHLLVVHGRGRVASATVGRVTGLLGVPGTAASVLSTTASGATGSLPPAIAPPPVTGVAGVPGPPATAAPGPAAAPSVPVTGTVITGTGLCSCSRGCR